MAKIIPLCSSSKGNAVLACIGGTNILIDVGCSFKALNMYLSDFGLTMKDISIILITHEHSDHAKGLEMLTKHTNIPVYATRGTIGGLIEKRLLASHNNIFTLSEIENSKIDVEITYFQTLHDSNDSVGYIIKSNEYSFAYCTDLGEVTQEVRNAVYSCHTVFLESNYCYQLLNNNPNYPFFLKERIKSKLGHLSNEQSADFSVELINNGTRRIILGHLSQENNKPEIAYSSNSETLARHGIVTGVDYTLDIAMPVHKGMVVAI